MAPTVATNLDYLISRLRLHLGDIDSTRYTDDWLQSSLQASVITMMPWWNIRYLLDDDNDVYRNTDVTFDFTEPPIVQVVDTTPIVLMASIIIKSGTLENMAWNLGAWRDNEISYSNIEGGRTRDKSIIRDWEQLTSIIKPPQSRLHSGSRQPLPGYRGNLYEHDINEP